MTLYPETAVRSAPFSAEGLQTHWRQLNTRYFSGSLSPITIRWSRRLTSSVGMFSSRGRARTTQRLASGQHLREIRLSLPLFERLAQRTQYAEQELLNTLAHEMIHQWQFEVLHHRPDHGLEFSRKMTEINRYGEVAITTYHSLEAEVIALSRFAWRCKDCGHIYRRHRKTIHPKRHHCGACQGPLQELIPLSRAVIPPSFSTPAPFPRATPQASPPPRSVSRFEQLCLALL